MASGEMLRKKCLIQFFPFISNKKSLIFLNKPIFLILFRLYIYNIDNISFLFVCKKYSRRMKKIKKYKEEELIVIIKS